MVSPFVAPGSAFSNYTIRNKSLNGNNGTMFPFWFLCYVNSSGQGLAVHSGNNMFIAIEYSEDDLNVSTNIR